MNPTPIDPDEESRRLARLLGQLLKLDHRSVRSVEQDLGLGSSALGKVLNGNIRLQASHIFMVLNVLEMTPAQFFHMVYPRKPRMPVRPARPARVRRRFCRSRPERRIAYGWRRAHNRSRRGRSVVPTA